MTIRVRLLWVGFVCMHPPLILLSVVAAQSRSDQQSQLILKGGLNLYRRSPNAARPTQDIDFAVEAITTALESVIISIASLDLGDHVVSDSKSLKVSVILEGAAQDGLRFELTAHVGSAHAKLALDITSGNTIHRDPVWLEFPSLLGLDTGAILGYPLETIFSEKLAAAI
jgi:hypothetical protein